MYACNNRPMSEDAQKPEVPSESAQTSIPQIEPDTVLGQKRKRPNHEDSLSHRIIEKRRRDRMNNCLADLSRLIPSSYIKKGRGRIEKTEIIEMSIRYLKNLQTYCTCEAFNICAKYEKPPPQAQLYVDQNTNKSLSNDITSEPLKKSSFETFKLGYEECLNETCRFLVESEGFYSGDSLYVRLSSNLNKHLDILGRGSCQSSCGNSQFIRQQEISLGNNLNTASSSGYHTMSGSENGNCQEPTEQNYTNLPADETANYTNLNRYNSKDFSDNYRFARSSLSSLCSEKCSPYSEKIAHKDVSDSKTRRSKPNQDAQYKFKANMQQRFRHQHSPSHYSDSFSEARRVPASKKFDFDHLSRFAPLPDPPPPANWREKYNYNDRLIDQRLYDSHSLNNNEASHCQDPLWKFREGNRPQGTNPSYSNLGNSNFLGKTIPIFALHPKEGHYIALTVDSSIIAPYLLFFTQTENVALHPITISVNLSSPINFAIKKYLDEHHTVRGEEG